ncbi:MAG: hypothetical protein U0232_19700 [Thermomicrobiales bacterium]
MGEQASGRTGAFLLNGLSRRDLVERLFETGADGASCNWPDWIIDMRTT